MEYNTAIKLNVKGQKETNISVAFPRWGDPLASTK